MPSIDWRRFREIVDATYSDPQKEYSKKTRTKSRQVLREMNEFCGTTHDLTLDAILDWKARWSDRGAMTTNSLLAYLRTATHFGMALGLIPDNPFRKSSRLLGSLFISHRKRLIRRHLSRAELETLLSYLKARRFDSAADGRLYAIAMLIAYTGLRAMEALRLKVVDIDLVEMSVKIVPRFGRLKTEASEATLPVHPAAIECLREWIERCDSEWLFPGARKHGPWTGGSNGKRPADYLGEAAVRAGLPEGTTLLMLRHTFATLASAFGLSPREVQQMLRHTTVKTQEHYISRDMDHLHEQMRRFELRIVG